MKFNLALDNRFKKKAKGRIERFEFEVGVLKDSPHRIARPKKAGLKSFHGGQARKISSKTGGATTAQISQFVRRRRRVNYLTAPFKRTYGKSADINRFTKEFFKYAFGRSQEKRLINLLQAVVRNPILRGDYGPNRKKTAQRKGFNRFMIDTGKLFSSIIARVSKRA